MGVANSKEPPGRLTTRLGVGGPLLLSLLLAACGGSGRPAAAKVHPPSLATVSAAMEAQARIVDTQTFGHTGLVGGVPAVGRFGRVVIDGKAQYLAGYAPSGRLMVLDRAGVEYRRTGACFRRFTASHVNPQIVWSGEISELGAHLSRMTLTGDTITYHSPSQTITVDARTKLIRSVSSPAFPRGGVPAERGTYAYPRSVPELGAPRVCR